MAARDRSQGGPWKRDIPSTLWLPGACPATGTAQLFEDRRLPPEPAEAPVGVIRPDAGRPDIEITSPEPAGPDLPPDLEAQIEELRTAMAVLDAQRDEFLHLLLQSSATGLGRAAQRWQTLTRNHGWAERVLSRPAHWLWMLLTLRWPGGLRVNPLFDETWYREQYDDAPAGRRAAFRQYRQRSMTDGRDPNPLFDTGWYLTRNPDVRGGHLHPLDHYLLMGWREARDPGPAFNGFDYLRENPECVALAMCPLEHLMRSGGTGRIDAVADPSAGPAGPRSSVQRTRDYYQRYGARRTVAKVASRLMSRSEEDASRSAGLLQLVLDAAPEVIRAHLDTPRTDAPEGSSTLLVTGWACSDAGISSIEVYIDEALAGTAEPGLPRPDVADALPEVAGSGVSGFAGRIRIADTEPGHHGVQVVIRDGGASVRTMFSSFERIEPESMYHHYYVRSLPSPAEVEEMERWASSTKGLPRFLFVVTDEHDADLRATLASIAGQSYAAVRCAVFSADGNEERVRSTLDELGIRRSDRRWSVASEPGDLLPARKRADRMVGFIRAGETLTPHALFSYAAEAASRDVTLAYSDHDAVRQTGQHVDPWFLPEWSPDHLLSRDYIGGVYVARDGARLRELVPDLLTDGGPYWRYRLLLALGSEGGRVVRVPRVLWSAPEDRGDEAEQAHAEETIVIEALAARGARATVSTVAGGSSGPLRRIRHELVGRPRISVIVPTTARRRSRGGHHRAAR